MLREAFGSYTVPMRFVLAVAVVGAIAILMLPRQEDAKLSAAAK